MIVEKAVNMASMMHIPVLGVVENMSYYVCPTCGTKQYIFGESHADVVAESHGIHTLCRLPIRQDLAKAVDGGAVESLQENGLDGLVNTILA
jgi:Mrp family chromosome partitioning ATPase